MRITHYVTAMAGAALLAIGVSGFIPGADPALTGGGRGTKIITSTGCTLSALRSSNGSQVGWTNSIPDGAGSCSSGGGCHSGGTATPVFTLTSSPAFTSNTYVPGTTYTITVKLTGYPKFGFDIEMLNGTLATSTATGTFSALTNCQIVPAGTYPKSITQTAPIATASSATYSWVAPASGTVYIYGDGNGVNGTGSTSGDKAVLFTQVLMPCAGATTPGTIAGTATVCSGSSNTYSIAAVSGATSYTWTLPGGWTGTSTSASITATAGTTSGNITVVANNSCGSSAAQTFAVTVSAPPVMPAAISGTTTVCSGSSNTYTVAAVSGATSYTWTLPGGWSGTSATNSITATAGATGGNISVTANNSCGSSTVRTLAVTMAAGPATPAAISGTAAVCSGSSNTYTIPAVSGATSYTWTLPGGWSGTSTSTSIAATAGTINGNITVTANNGCGSSTAQTFAVSVTNPPAAPAAISGTAAVCAGTSTTYTVAAVSGATSYTWTLPGGWTGTSSTNSITTTTGASSGNISVTANNSCGSSAAHTLAVTINTAPAMPGVISGGAAPCSGTSSGYSIAAVSGATSYTWTLPGGWTGTSSTSSISATAGTSGGNITVIANNACGSSPAQTFAVTSGVTPATPGAISGSTAVCSGAADTYTVAAVSGASSYTWSLPGGWTGTSTTNSITTVPSATSGNVTVKANNACGSSAISTLAITVGGVAPAQPVAISGTSTICSGTSNTYSVPVVSGASSYTWSLPGGWSGSSTSTSITTTAGTGSGTITVTANGSCGSSTPQTLNVTANSTPVLPTAISGSLTACAGATGVYSVPAVTGVTSYSWTLPGGWTGTSTSNSINTTSNGTAGTITVTASNACGTSPVQTLAVGSGSTPVITGAISGSTAVCSGSAAVYSIPAVSGASSYTWTLPGGWTGTSTTDSITTMPGATNGTITVTADNACGSSAAQTLNASVGAMPVMPAAIAGSNSVCSGTSNTYTTTAVPGATSYTWTLPGGWMGTSTSNSITATVGFVGGTISVSANNGCGTSPAQTSSVLVSSPNLGISTSGPVYTAAASGATYQWLNCMTNTLLTGETNRTYTAGTNGSYAVIVTQNTCTDTSVCITINSVGIEENSTLPITVYPNPSNGIFVFDIGTSIDFNKKTVLEVYNVMGTKVFTSIITNATFEVDLSNESTGIYFAKIETEKGVEIKRLIKK